MVAALARGKEISGWYRMEKQVKTLLVSVIVFFDVHLGVMFAVG